MKVLVDTNVVLDLLLSRIPFVDQAVEIFDFIERRALDGYFCATTVTTIDYLLGTQIPRPAARKALEKLLGLFSIAPVNQTVLVNALRSRILDFEDAVIEQAALSVGLDAIVTRNVVDFRKSVVSAVDPVTLLALMRQ